MKIICKYMFADGIIIWFPRMPDDEADETVKNANKVLTKSFVWSIPIYPSVS